MKGRRIQWFDDELAWIAQSVSWYPTRAAQHAAFRRRFGRDDVPFTAFAALCKRRGWLTGRDGRFAPGQESHNKGRKGECAPGSEKGWFPPGHRPHTWRGAGHESVDGRDGYVWMIVDETNPYTGAATRRVRKHRWLWEQAHGPVPAGHCLKCLDGDRTNTDPSNWECVPRALLPMLNGGPHRTVLAYDDAEPDVKPALMTLARLRRAAARAGKGEGNG